MAALSDAHPEVDAQPEVTVRFWAGARRAAGHPQETLKAANISQLRAILAARPALHDVMAVAALLVDGQAASDSTALAADCVVDVLPPFAGGAESGVVDPFVGAVGEDLPLPDR